MRALSALISSIRRRLNEEIYLKVASCCNVEGTPCHKSLHCRRELDLFVNCFDRAWLRSTCANSRRTTECQLLAGGYADLLLCHHQRRRGLLTRARLFGWREKGGLDAGFRERKTKITSYDAWKVNKTALMYGDKKKWRALRRLVGRKIGQLSRVFEKLPGGDFAAWILLLVEKHRKI